jgi:hypothetical protein
MKAGITGVNAPQVLFEPLDVLVIFISLLEKLSTTGLDIAVLKPAPSPASNKLSHPFIS